MVRWPGPAAPTALRRRKRGDQARTARCSATRAQTTRRGSTGLTNIDDCHDSPCGTLLGGLNQTCTDLVANHTCTCTQAFKLVIVETNETNWQGKVYNQTCRDIDDCAMDMGTGKFPCL